MGTCTDTNISCLSAQAIWYYPLTDWHTILDTRGVRRASTPAAAAANRYSVPVTSMCSNTQSQCQRAEADTTDRNLNQICENLCIMIRLLWCLLTEIELSKLSIYNNWTMRAGKLRLRSLWLLLLLFLVWKSSAVSLNRNCFAFGALRRN